jgi:hypothetical protein
MIHGTIHAMAAIQTPLEETERRVVSGRSPQTFYGAPIGIMLLDEVLLAHYPPGSVGNAGTWSAPARYKTMPGLKFSKLLGPYSEELEAIAIQTAADLAHEGARLITSNCGFMIRYQEAVRAAVDVPVLLSSLLLAPFIERMLPRDKVLGVVTASKSSLTPTDWVAAGFPGTPERVVVAGLEECPAFAGAILTGERGLDVYAVESETIDAAVGLIRSRPDVGALLLECSELPTYAAAVQRATGVPVFDFSSLVEFFMQGLKRQPFTGFDY